MRESLGKFHSVALDESHRGWEACTGRLAHLYNRPQECRSPFARDHSRILHCMAFRRLKHKTQVFFSPSNDHICTRIEHVNHVASISYTMAQELGLNTELTGAIAIGHDLGHAPFGHAGESFLKELVYDKFGIDFWHERQSLRVVDEVELLPDHEGRPSRLNLTYAVRDGIVCHCGEVDQNALRPREECLDLAGIRKAGSVEPFTWEGCIVKVADKISYIGRDIEDAITLKLLGRDELRELKRIIAETGHSGIKNTRNTVLIHNFITDIIEGSSPEKGIVIGDRTLAVMNRLREFNYRHIYRHRRVESYKEYAKLVIGTLFRLLSETFSQEEGGVVRALWKRVPECPLLYRTFLDYVKNRVSLGEDASKGIYSLADRRSFHLAVTDFIAGMTDNFALQAFSQAISF